MILSEVGVNIGPIIASAGILGVALGFGAQSLVKDFLSGIFMIFEDQYGVGDVGRPRRGLRHRRGGQPAGHPAARRQRHGLVRPQRRDPPRRQHEPELGAHRARRHGRLRRGPGPGPARARRRSPTTCGTTRTSAARSSRSPRCGASRRSASTASSSGSPSRPRRWSSGRWRARCASGSRPASTTRASRSPFPQRVIWHRTSAPRPTARRERRDVRDRRLSRPARTGRRGAQARAASSVIVTCR